MPEVNNNINKISNMSAYQNRKTWKPENSTYTKDDKNTFIKELNTFNIHLDDISYDLNNFNSFIGFMKINPYHTPGKLGVYITKVMHFDKSTNNKVFHRPEITHKKKYGDCDDATILSLYSLKKAGYKKPIKDGQIPTPAKEYDNKIKEVSQITSFSSSGLHWPLFVATSTNSLDTPINNSDFHALCVYEELDSDKLNILETRTGLSDIQSNNIIDLIDKFEPGWQRMIFKYVNNGIVDNSKPFVMIKRSEVYPNNTQGTNK